MNNWKSILLIINLVGVFILFNYSILKKENLLDDGQLILLELAPVDPRSLMQGDYMNLRYAIARNIQTPGMDKRGYIVVKLDYDGIAELVRYQYDTEPLNKDEYLINFTNANYNLNIGAESFFFEEGSAEKFEEAEYGGLVIDNEGNSLLVGLYDSTKTLIK